MDPLLTRVDTEVAAGRLWRAKEMIRGNISNAWPPAEVVERYGQILLSLGDELEAGKYLWLSGVRTAEYEKAVALFLARHGRQGRDILLAQLPKTLRRVAFDQLPIDVRRELAAHGIGSDDLGLSRRSRGHARAASRWKDAIAIAGGVGLVVCVIVGAVVGFQTIVKWVSQAFR